MKWLCPGCQPNPGADRAICPQCCGYCGVVTIEIKPDLSAFTESLRRAHRVRKMRRIDQAHRAQPRKAGTDA